MAGFTSTDNMIYNMSTLGNQYLASFSKQFNPTAAAVANEIHTLFRGGGQPQADAIFDTGTSLMFQSLTDQVTSGGNLYHGQNIGAAGDGYKVLTYIQTGTAAATTAPGTLYLIDLLGWMRVTPVTVTTAQTTIWSNTFTADAGTDIITYTNDWQPYTKVQFTTTTTLPAGLSLATDYWLVRQSSTTAKVATSYANAIAGTTVDITDAGTGTHTLTAKLPRYSDGAGVDAFFFNPQATALGAGTPALTLGYTNSAGTASRATPTTPSAPVGKTAASNSHVLYTGATGVGKFGLEVPRQGADGGIRSVETIRNSSTYTSGMYTVGLYKELARIPVTTLGINGERGMVFDVPSQPRVYDGAALYFLWKSGVATPANSIIDGHLIFGWS